MKKIIAYSLWQQSKPMDGKKYQTGAMYIQGALQNLKIQKEQGIYSDWTLRFYINTSISIDIQKQIEDLGGEVISTGPTNIPGMYWRFFPLEDPQVDIFIVRDTDSRINKREEKAVLEWLDSDKIIHIMRDHPHHYYKILGGMWGYKNYLQRISISPSIHRFLSLKNYQFQRMDDMKFLELLYAKFKGKTMEHDQFFNLEKSQPFPDNSYQNSYYHYVGEIFDENEERPNLQRDIELLKNQNYRSMISNKIFR